VPQQLLLADDSVTIQRVIELTFADEDIEVIAVSDGEQAIAQIEAHPPDIVLADIGMPGKDGYEVAAHVKQSPRLSHIPVVLLAGAFEPVDQARAAAAGCDGVLTKPFEPQMVIGRVKELLARPQPAPGAMAPFQAESPATGSVGQSRGTSGGRQAAPADLDNYFERLDEAFSNLSRGSSAPTGQATEGPPTVVPGGDETDWYSTSRSAPPVEDRSWNLPIAPASAGEVDDLPLSYASPQADVDRSGAQPNLPQQWPVAPVAGASAATPADAPPAPHLPSLAAAFTAILTAEQRAGGPSVPPAWPSAEAAVSGDAIEEVVRRVLDRLSDRVVRETVSDTVSKIADRLVREEIDRIKASIT
jgi:CheY-like chemotaxis protein